MRFDLLSLNLVLAIAETGSLTRAAEREHLALAAASKRLSDLEARLGVVLFERRARGVEITDAGRALVRHIRSLNASLHALESEVVEYARGLKGHLRLAANASAIAECLPPPLAALCLMGPMAMLVTRRRSGSRRRPLAVLKVVTLMMRGTLRAALVAARLAVIC